ncbi:MAG: rod-binding protein [Alkalilacustris sp.]
MTGPIPPIAQTPIAPKPGADQSALREAALALEARFLSIMLESAGFGAAREAFGGGIGESQMTSFLTEAHAEAMTRRGGIGLAESLFQALKDRRHDP